MVSIVKNPTLLDQWCRQQAMQFSVTKRAVLAYDFHVPPGMYFINGLPVLTTQCVNRLGLELPLI